MEDNRTNQVVARRMLRNLGHEVEIANNGSEALEILTTSPRPDLILMDVVMPVMDGLTATQRIRAKASKESRIPIIALTANVMPEDRERYVAADMDDFLAKPIEFNELRNILTKWT